MLVGRHGQNVIIVNWVHDGSVGENPNIRSELHPRKGNIYGIDRHLVYMIGSMGKTKNDFGESSTLSFVNSHCKTKVIVEDI